ncbi:MAG: MFS transporter, partial [Marmoricola sp.]|nr:MFS transporter [Marmoricola sp.]
TLGLVAIVFGLSRAGNQAYGWGDSWTITSLVAGVLLLGLFVLIERRVEHPLLPFRILLHRTRATAFATMMIVPAAMFAMFYFLSLYVQNIMGYSPIEAGVAFLPFCFGMVIAATVGSKLMSLVDPRFIAGFGTILAGFSLFMFSRLSVDDSLPNLVHAASAGTTHLGDTVNYWTDLFPYIFTMSVGMGLTFVPMTLAAVHGVGQRDSGIGSGVLNTMQQVGGALGLATLATVAVHFTQQKADAIVSSFKAAGGSAPTGQAAANAQNLVGQAAFANGATHAFIVGAFMMWAASVIVWIFLNVKHEELATDDAPEGVAVG